MAPASLGRLFTGLGRRSRKKQRKLQPLDPARPCPISRLPDDIILHIFNFVRADSPRSMLNLARVHPHFYHHVRYVQHHRVGIDLDRSETASKRLDLIEENGLLPAIHELHVLSRYDHPDQQCLSRLGGLIAGMTGLRDIYWEYAPIPAEVLESIRKLPLRVRLHVVVRDGNGRNPAPRQLLAVLEGSPSLVSVRLETTYFYSEDCLSLSQPLKTLLLTCPNLKDLSIDLHLPRQGCVVFGVPREYSGFGFSNDQRPLRPWESLAIHSYNWGYSTGVDIWGSIGYPGDGLEMDYWAETFDWSALKRLEDTTVSQVIFANRIAPKLTALREVRFTNAQDLRGNLLQTFFESVPSMLESVSIPKLGPVGISALIRHASALRSLTIHQPELSHDTISWEADVISDEDLGRLSDSLPHLEELGLDIMRVDNDWPRSKFEALTHFPRLQTLELWFGLGDWPVYGPPRPVLKATSAVQLFMDLRHARPTLEQLRLHSGCPPPLGLGLLADTAYYPEQNAASFVCRVSERDDEALSGKVTVMSPMLSQRLNDRMDRILSGQERRENVQGNLIALQVALDGPMKYADWELWRRRW